MVRWLNGEMVKFGNGAKKILFGLIGFPLDHSWSAEWFTEKFRKEANVDYEYRLFPLKKISDVADMIYNNPELSGLNVTIPYKEQIIPFLSSLDETAKAIGAVNTIRISRNEGLILTTGFNTDAPGFRQTLSDQIPGGPALILGTGGVARAIAYVLKERNSTFNFVSRKRRGPGIISYSDLTSDIIGSYHFIINATPLGMYPATDQFPPIPYQLITANHFLYDLIYNPEETQFLKLGKAMKAQTKNGLQMLNNQAELSYDIFLKGA